MTKAERQRRWRQRRAQGLRRVAVDADEIELLGALLESGRLTEEEALDPAAISRAASEVLQEWAARWMR